MLIDKIAQLYRQTEKQPQTQRQQPQTVAKWWQDSFWKKIILDDEEIEELMPPVYCSDADIIERHFKNKPVEYYIHCNTMPIKLEPPD